MPDGSEKLMKAMILEPENHKEPAEEEGAEAEPGRVEAAWFLEKRNRKICSTIRPLHLAVMLLTCFCLLLACPRKLIPGAEEPLARLAGDGARRTGAKRSGPQNRSRL